MSWKEVKCNNFSPRFYQDFPDEPLDMYDINMESYFNMHPSDVVFVVQGRRFLAHRQVCGPFLQMLGDGIGYGKLELEIEIRDCSAEVFNKLLFFLYTSHIDFSEHDVWLIYDASQIYQLNTLTERCEKYILSLINTQNVWDIFEIANKIPNSQRIISKCKELVHQLPPPTPVMNTFIPQIIAPESPPVEENGQYLNYNRCERHPSPQRIPGTLSPKPKLLTRARSRSQPPPLTDIVATPTSIGKEIEAPSTSFAPIYGYPSPTETPQVIDQFEEVLRGVYDMDDKIQIALTHLNSLTSMIKLLLKADRISLFLYNKETNELCTLSNNNSKASMCEIRIPCDLGIAGAVFLSGTIVNSGDPYQDTRFLSDVDKQTGYKTHNLLCMPIILKGRNLSSGVIEALNKKGEGGFTKEDERLLGLVCDLAAAVHEKLIPDAVDTHSIITHYNSDSDTSPIRHQEFLKPPKTKKSPNNNHNNNNSNNNPRSPMQYQFEHELIKQEYNNDKSFLWRNYKRRKRDSIPIFHFKLPSGRPDKKS